MKANKGNTTKTDETQNSNKGATMKTNIDNFSTTKIPENYGEKIEVLDIQNLISRNILSAQVSNESFVQDKEYFQKLVCDAANENHMVKHVKQQWHFKSSFANNLASLATYFLDTEFHRCEKPESFRLDLFWAKFYQWTQFGHKIGGLLDMEKNKKIKNQYEIFSNYYKANDDQIFDCTKDRFCQLLSDGVQSLIISHIAEAMKIQNENDTDIMKKYFFEFIGFVISVQNNIMSKDFSDIKYSCVAVDLKSEDDSDSKSDNKSSNDLYKDFDEEEWVGCNEKSNTTDEIIKLATNRTKDPECREVIAEIAEVFLEKWTPEKIYEKISERVYKQEEAKKSISLQVYNHIVKLANPELELRKQNSLLIGPSGSGKSEIVRALKEIMPVPVIELNMGFIRPESWKGMSLSEYLYLESLDYEHPWTFNYAIYFFDEVDKILNHANSKNHSEITKDAQAGLLKILEEGNVRYKSNGHSFTVNFKDTTIILAGAFEGMLEDNSIRINSFSDKKYNSSSCIYKKLSNAGMTTELIGRIGNVLNVNKLEAQDFLYILKHIQSSIIDTLRIELEQQGMFLTITDEAMEIAAREVATIGLGVRGLEGIFRPAVTAARFEAFKNGDTNICICKDKIAPYVSEESFEGVENVKPSNNL